MWPHFLHAVHIKSLFYWNLPLVDANSRTSDVLLSSNIAALSFCRPGLLFPDKCACDQSKRSPFPQTEHFFVFHQRLLFVLLLWVHNWRLWLLFAQITKVGGAKCSLYRRKHRVQVNERNSDKESYFRQKAFILPHCCIIYCILVLLDL